MNVINSLTLTANISVPAGVTLVVKGDRTLTVGKGTTLDLTGGGLALENNSTFTVNGTVNAKATVSLTSFGIGIMPGPAGNVTINGSGIIHLKTQGILLAVTAGQNLTLAGSVTLDGLSTGTTYPGTDTPYPAGIGGDATDNIFHVVFVGGTLNMLGGTITGNYNIDSTQVGGGGVEVNKYDGGYGAALFTMSGGVITGNGSNYDGGGVNVCKGGTFIMQGNAEVSGNGAFFSSDGGGVSVHNGGYFTMKGGVIKNNTGYRGGGVCVRDNEIDISTFIMEGGTIYGSDSDYANTASS
ncbi:MAG: hypothetical protein LBS06_07230, partial [Treponema sp.]|nr:hypothetical protein [Treponema sp.]